MELKITLDGLINEKINGKERFYLDFTIFTLNKILTKLKENDVKGAIKYIKLNIKSFEEQLKALEGEY